MALVGTVFRTLVMSTLSICKCSEKPLTKTETAQLWLTVWQTKKMKTGNVKVKNLYTIQTSTDFR